MQRQMSSYFVVPGWTNINVHSFIKSLQTVFSLSRVFPGIPSRISIIAPFQMAFLGVSVISFLHVSYLVWCRAGVMTPNLVIFPLYQSFCVD